MWGAIVSFLADYAKGMLGKETTQGASPAANVNAGAANSGVGSLWKDVAAGNYGSAAGNVVQMGKNNPSPPMQPTQPPPMPQQQQQRQQPPPAGMTQSPYLQQLMSRYLG